MADAVEAPATVVFVARSGVPVDEAAATVALVSWESVFAGPDVPSRRSARLTLTLLPSGAVVAPSARAAATTVGGTWAVTVTRVPPSKSWTASSSTGTRVPSAVRRAVMVDGASPERCSSWLSVVLVLAPGAPASAW